MMIYPTCEITLRPGIYYRVFFACSGSWFPTLHLFEKESEAEQKAKDLQLSSDMAHRVRRIIRIDVSVDAEKIKKKGVKK